MNRLHALALAGIATTAALTGSCAAPAVVETEQSVVPDLSDEVGQLDLGIEGIELGIGLASTTSEGTVQSRFTARSTVEGAALVTGLRLELWIDSDEDGIADENERGVILGRREPEGIAALTLPFEVPFERGKPLRFVAEVDSTLGSKTVPGDFALPQSTNR